MKKVVCGLNDDAFKLFRWDEEGTGRSLFLWEMRNNKKKRLRQKGNKWRPRNPESRIQKWSRYRGYRPTADIWDQTKLPKAMVLQVWSMHSWENPKTLSDLRVPNYFHNTIVMLLFTFLLYWYMYWGCKGNAKTAGDLAWIETVSPNDSLHEGFLHYHTLSVKTDACFI